MAARGTFSLALSGGHSPWPMYEALADEDVPWEAVRVLQVDERIAPRGDADRNLTELERRLPPAAVLRLEAMPVEDDDLDAAAAGYGAELPNEIDWRTWASGRTATRPRSSRATRSSTSPTCPWR